MMYPEMRYPAPKRASSCPGDMHYFDSAQMLLRLQSEGCTRAEISRMTGLPMQQIAERMRLLELDDGLRSFLRGEDVPERIALSLLSLPDVVTRRRMAHRIVRERLCIRDSMLLVESARRKCRWQRREPPAPPARLVIRVIRDVRPYRNAIRDIAGQMLSAGVRATFTERRNGSLMELTVSYPLRRRRTERHQSV